MELKGRERKAHLGVDLVPYPPQEVLTLGCQKHLAYLQMEQQVHVYAQDEL
jgi:hypothetical protein